MEARGYRKEDVGALGRVMALAFGDSTEEAEQYFDPEKNPRLDPDGVYVVEEDGEVRASATVLPLEMYLDGRPVPVGGISGVATHPAYRRRGYAGGLMRAALRGMRERGMHLSLLGPFNHSFYRAYGWELAMEGIRYTLSPAELPTSPEQKRVRERRSEDLHRMAELLEAEASRHPCCVRRSGGRWRELLGDEEQRAPGSKELRAVVYDRDGSAGGVEGYVLYKQSEREGQTPPRRLTLYELVAATPEARAALLSFAGAYDPGEFQVRHEVPRGEPLHPHLKSSYVEAKVEPGMMLRLVDVEGALGLLGRTISAPLVLEVADDGVPENAGEYTVGGGGVVRGAEAGEKVSLDVRQLAQLYAGYLLAEQLARLGLIEPGSEKALRLLGELFPVGDPWILPLDGF